MISEGPSLVETLPAELQTALMQAVQGEELVIAVRGNPQEAFAATRERLLLLKEPAISGDVEVRGLPLATVMNFRAEPRPMGGRLSWQTTEFGAPTSLEYPPYDAAKYDRVARRLNEMISQKKVPTTPGTAPAAPEPGSPSCPKCGTAVPEGGAWCPNCGLQVSDPCWECGKPLAQGANFCAFCGTPNTEPAVVQCPRCSAVVGQGMGYCAACGAQARPACAECDRPMRREWTHCPTCGGEPAWELEGASLHRTVMIEEPVAPRSPAPVLADQDAEELNAAGVRAYERGDYREAARLFQQAADADGTHAGYYTNLGVAYGELGDDLQAFNAYRRAIDLNPRELQAYLNMGYLYNERERHAEAREMWEKVVQLDPDSVEAQEARDNLKNLEEV